jgi:sugar O-acyltransferase (sialic acid O-acetyltransferase NeuD family)
LSDGRPIGAFGSTDGPMGGPLRPLLFLGASTAFFEIQEIIHDINRVQPRHEIVGLLDDDPKWHGQVIDGVPVLGPLDLARERPDVDLVFGIGSHTTRLQRHRIISRLGLPDERFITLIHPLAKVYPSAHVGPGSIVHSNVVLANHVRLDGFNVVTFGALLGPYTHMHRFAMVTSLAVVLSRVELGAGSFVGASACIQDGVKVGAGALIGMAAAVYRNVDPGAIVLGNPARLAYRVPVPPELASISPSDDVRPQPVSSGGVD